ncbi:MAG: winged helix-turn-helix transcriptional regulator [Asgard group archaeon]|nr:winged helix-turn-helix transcriptional regulator [Asgard group archaeon]
MSKEIKISDQIKKRYQEAMSNDIEFSVITVLRWNKTLNLKKIAKLIDKPESTTIRYLKRMLNDELITIDIDETASSWGKFYRLAKPIKYLYDKNKEQMSERNKQEFDELFQYLDRPEEEIENYAKSKIIKREDEESEINMEIAKRNLTFMHNLEDMILNEFIEAINEFNELQEELDTDFLKKNLSLAPVDILLSNKWTEIANFKHLLKYYQLFNKFDQEIRQLRKEIIEEMDEKKIPSEDRITLVIDFFMGTTEVKYNIAEKDQ